MIECLDADGEEVFLMILDENIIESDAAIAKLRDALPAEHGVIVDKLAALTKRLDAAKATAAANRMRKLANYATVLPPEALPGLLDSSATLDEFEEAAANTGSFWERVPALNLWRNILTLVPLLWTWWSLWRSTSAYQSEVHLHPSMAYQPFLILWENGFGQGFWPSFSTVAFGDVFLFGCIIALTWRINDRERKAQQFAREFVAEMDASIMDLVAILGQSHDAISGKPTDWAKTVETVIKKAMNGAITAAKASEDASGRAADQVRDYIAHVNLQLERARANDKAFFAQLHQNLMTEFKTASQSLMTEYKTGTEAFRRNFDQVNSKYETLAQQATEAVERASASVTQVQQDVLEAFEHINEENTQYFARANKDALDHIHEAAEEARKITSEQLYPMLGKYQTTLDSFATQIGAYTTSSQILANSVSKIENVTLQLGDNAGQFATTASNMEQQVKAVATATEKLSQDIGAAASELKAAAGGLQSSLTQTQAAAKQTIDAVASAQALTNQVTEVGRQVAEASSQWGNAQIALSSLSTRSQDALNQIVAAMQSATKKMARAKVQLTVKWPWQNDEVAA